jgi:hypothetical protein
VTNSLITPSLLGLNIFHRTWSSNSRNISSSSKVRVHILFHRRINLQI